MKVGEHVEVASQARLFQQFRLEHQHPPARFGTVVQQHLYGLPGADGHERPPGVGHGPAVAAQFPEHLLQQYQCIHAVCLSSVQRRVGMVQLHHGHLRVQCARGEEVVEIVYVVQGIHGLCRDCLLQRYGKASVEARKSRSFYRFCRAASYLRACSKVMIL